MFAHEDDALLMEKAEGPASLADMARDMAPGGGDDEASRLICVVVARLHAPTPGTHSLPDLVPLVPDSGNWGFAQRKRRKGYAKSIQLHYCSCSS